MKFIRKLKKAVDQLNHLTCPSNLIYCTRSEPGFQFRKRQLIACVYFSHLSWSCPPFLSALSDRISLDDEETATRMRHIFNEPEDSTTPFAELYFTKIDNFINETSMPNKNAHVTLLLELNEFNAYQFAQDWYSIYGFPLETSGDYYEFLNYCYAHLDNKAMLIEEILCDILGESGTEIDEVICNNLLGDTYGSFQHAVETIIYVVKKNRKYLQIIYDMKIFSMKKTLAKIIL